MVVEIDGQQPIGRGLFRMVLFLCHVPSPRCEFLSVYHWWDRALTSGGDAE
jgi:hypothetical protein